MKVKEYGFYKKCSACGKRRRVENFNRSVTNGTVYLQSWCKSCSADRRRGKYLESAREYKRRNAEKLREQTREWRANNRELVRKFKRDYWARNKDRLKSNPAFVDRLRENGRAHYWRYVEEHRLEARERQRKRLDLTAAANLDYEKIYERDRKECYLCFEPIRRSDCHFDHVTPLCLGGEHSYKNVRATHSRCNLRKNSRILRRGAFASV